MSKPKPPPPTATTTARTSRSTRSASRSTTSAPPPWIIHGRDYGPAVLAIDDLIGWAFDLAARNVADWPEGERRVKNARRAARDLLHGRPSHVADDDVVFAASLLIRILDADLGLGFSEILTVLDELGLPTADVPFPPRPPRRPGRRVQPPQVPPMSAPAALAVLRGFADLVPPAPLAPVIPLRPRPRAVASPPPCVGCTRPVFAVAA